jgi:hypothetical protein
VPSEKTQPNERPQPPADGHEDLGRTGPYRERGYQTPQDGDDHWTPPPDKSPEKK